MVDKKNISGWPSYTSKLKLYSVYLDLKISMLHPNDEAIGDTNTRENEWWISFRLAQTPEWALPLIIDIWARVDKHLFQCVYKRKEEKELFSDSFGRVTKKPIVLISFNSKS
jgi:hypothetical protein